MADANDSTRVCSACKVEKSLEMFSFSNKPRGKRHTQCKECCKAASKAWHQANKEGRNAKWLEWVRAHPEQFAATQKRFKDKNREKIRAANAVYSALNREQINEKSRQRYALNKERHKIVVYDWRKRNPEAFRAVGANYRARKNAAEGTHTSDDIKKIYELQRGCCAFCRKKLGKKYDVDHVMPLKLGGSNGKENLQILCPSCNRKKNAIDPVEYANRNGRLL